MSTPAQVRQAWYDYVWSQTMATQYTDKIFQYDIINLSRQDFTGLLYNQEVNFFTAINVKQQVVNAGVKHLQWQHLVEVNYYLSPSLPTNRGDNHNRVIDRLEALETAIRDDATFGKRWNSTVDHWQVVNVIEPQIVEVAPDTPVWRGTYLYSGSELIDCN
jgi:hypothetical protein